MPIGCLSVMSTLAGELVRLQPASVLDLGCGTGFYGAVVRQWLDDGVRPWKTTLHGVDGFAQYRNPCWALYDVLTVKPIEEYLATERLRWDAVLLLDVLEHFEHNVGERLLSQMLAILSDRGRLFVATPAVWMEQGAVHENEYERHRSLWTAEEFLNLGFSLLLDGTTDQFGNQMLLAVTSGAFG